MFPEDPFNSTDIISVFSECLLCIINGDFFGEVDNLYISALFEFVYVLSSFIWR